MSFRAILIDKTALISHGNWNEALQKTLQELGKYDVAVIDICEEMNVVREAASDIVNIRKNEETLQDKLNSQGFSFSECLIIADCEATVRQARAWNAAVLRYRISCSHLDIIAEGFEEIDYYFLERVYRRFHHLPWTIVETARCILREIMPEDLDALYELYRPEEITRYIDGLHEKSTDEEEFTRAYIENMYGFYGYGMWVVIEKTTGRLIGRAGLEHFDTGEQIELQLGYVIAQDKQKQGYATEVCQGILEYVKKELDFPAVYCLIRKGNIASVHLAEKLGFTFEKSMMSNGQEMQLYVKKIA